MNASPAISGSVSVSCPHCGGSMIERRSARGRFWGCRSYPRCKGTRPFSAPEPAKKPLSGPRMPVVGSPEQEAIWAEIASGSRHVVVQALAGTGKSFTCREAMHRVPASTSILYLAFSKAIVEEFKDGAPANATVCTLNSLGFRACKSVFPRAIMDDEKVAGIIADLYRPSAAMDAETQRFVVIAVEKMVSLCQSYNIDGTDAEELLEIASRHDVEMSVEVTEAVLALTPKVLREDMNRTGVMSFNDQLWFPIVHDIPMPKYDLIFVDEAQDLNTVQHEMICKMIGPSTRVVAVGDNNQAIFGFRGSDVDSIANLSSKLAATREVVTLPLTVTRRCGKNIVAKATEYVPTIKAMEDAVDGSVEYANEVDALAKYAPGDMVVCRFNAPLTSVAYGLIRRGIKAVIRGRDIGQGLINLLNKMRASSVSDMLAKLEAWKEREVSNVSQSRRAEILIASIEDRFNCIVALSEGASDLSEVRARIESVFSNFEANGQPKHAVVMSSIHRAKGLEADTVYWLHYNGECRAPQQWMKVQENNLRYVAVTRAKKRLVMVAKSNDAGKADKQP